MVKIVAFSGSIRKGSQNTQLLALAARMTEQAGAKVTLLDLADYPLPMYHADLEEQEGLPDSCLALKKIMRSHQGLMLACPEYNGSITPLLKNTLDWISRAHPDEPRGACYQGKVVALMSASPGGLGGLRGLNHVRDILSNLGSLVIPEKIAITAAHKAFDEQGGLLDEQKSQQLNKVCQRLVHVSSLLSV